MLYAGLFHCAATAAHFTDAAEIEAMLRVEAALAAVQGELGLIPRTSAAILASRLPGLQLDPAALAPATACNGVPVPALIEAARAALNQPEDDRFLHWGATSQDIMDTALALRLRAVFDLWQGGLHSLLHRLAAGAVAHARLPMAARTYGQHATPTSYGAVIAGWGWPVLDARAALPGLRRRIERVSLAGAAGTLSAMGPRGPEVRAALAQALALQDPGHGWHSDRGGISALAGWAASVAGALGKMGEDLTLLTQSGLELVRIEGAGASSTMPQKQNPVGPSALVALARHVQGLAALLQGTAIHRQQRDGAAWFSEWLALPPMAIALGRMIELAAELADRTAPDPEAMRRDLESGGGLILAEALSFALVDHAGLARPEAQARIKALCVQLRDEGGHLCDLVARAHPGPDWRGIVAADMLGTAPSEAGAFAARVAAPQ